MRNFTSPFNTICNPRGEKIKKAVGAFIVAVVVIGIATAIFQGIGWFVYFFLPLVTVLALAFFFGQSAELIGATIFVILVNLIGNEASAFLRIWLNDARVEQSFSYFMKLNVYKEFMLTFLVLATIDILTCAFKIFRIKNSNEINNHE